jgi:hypothetical protein
MSETVKDKPLLNVSLFGCHAAGFGGFDFVSTGVEVCLPFRGCTQLLNSSIKEEQLFVHYLLLFY